MPDNPDISHELVSVQVLIRFLLRMVLLSVFAALGSQGFARTLGSLLVLATFYCITVGAIRREAPFGPVLTYFDEAAAYAVIARLALWSS